MEAKQMRPPLPPFDRETAVKKVRLAEDAWNSRDAERVSLAYTVDSVWRNRAEFVTGREAIVQFLKRKWTRELDYRLIKELWVGAAIALQCASHTSGMTTAVTGSAPTATRTGSSTATGSCGAVTRASMTCRSWSPTASTSGRSVVVPTITPVCRTWVSE